MSRRHAALRGNRAMSRDEYAAVPENAEVLAALASGPLSTDALIARVRQPVGALGQRLQRLKSWGLVVRAGRCNRRRPNGVLISVNVWRLPTGAPTTRRREQDPAQPFALALPISVGRGSRWGAGLV